MERILYLECSSGISGDMTVGALLDLGASRQVLERALESLNIGGYHLHFGRVKKCGIDAYDFDVCLEDGHGHGNAHAHGEEHPHEEEHTHEAGHSHGGACACKAEEKEAHEHSHAHRNIRDIYAIIDRLDGSDNVKALARRIFDIVAESESKAHGVPVEEVHFHEVGAVDSIVDIISTAVCLENLGVKRVYVSPLAEGQGTVRCQHGVMPVPVPATLNIASAWDLELHITDNQGEMVTPTGAAIAAALRTEKTLPRHYKIEKIGLGAGKKEFSHANILRAMLLTETEKPDSLLVLETNLDDCTGEAMGFAMELLLEAGAKDVWYTPAVMKKNRPAYVLHVLCRETEREALEAIIFSCTTTIGIRRYPVERTELEREIRTEETSLGTVQVKVCRGAQGVRCYPEYESVRAVCRSRGLGFLEAYHRIMEEVVEKAGF